MSSVWTPTINEKSLVQTLIKAEKTDHDDDNSNLSHGAGTSTTTSSSSSSPTHSRSSPSISSNSANRIHEQHRGISLPLNSLYSEPITATTPATNINTVSSQELQHEQYSSTHGSSRRSHFILSMSVAIPSRSIVFSWPIRSTGCSVKSTKLRRNNDLLW